MTISFLLCAASYLATDHSPWKALLLLAVWVFLCSPPNSISLPVAGLSHYVPWALFCTALVLQPIGVLCCMLCCAVPGYRAYAPPLLVLSLVAFVFSVFSFVPVASPSHFDPDSPEARDAAVAYSPYWFREFDAGDIVLLLGAVRDFAPAAGIYVLWGLCLLGVVPFSLGCYLLFLDANGIVGPAGQRLQFDPQPPPCVDAGGGARVPATIESRAGEADHRIILGVCMVVVGGGSAIWLTEWEMNHRV